MIPMHKHLRYAVWKPACGLALIFALAPAVSVAMPKVALPRLSRVASLLKRIPPRATLKKIRAILPAGTRYQTVPMSERGDWKWNTIRFDGKYHGVLVFANDRRKYRWNEAEKMRVSALRASDAVHSVEVFLGDESLDENDAQIQRVTEKRLNEAIRVLGKPAQSETQTYGDGPGPEGWNATWKLSRARELYLAQDFTYGADGAHPFLMLTFGYSHLYRS